MCTPFFNHCGRSVDLIMNSIIIINNLPSHWNPEICFHKLTCIFHKRLFIPYLAQVWGDHRRKGIWFGWMGVFHCPVRPSSFPLPLPSLHILPCSPPPPSPIHPPHLEASLLCESHETVYSCLADITCLNRAPSYTYLLIPSTHGKWTVIGAQFV